MIQTFSPDYATARQRFRNLAQVAGAELHALTLTAQGPAGEPLTIDIAWLGARGAQRVLLHSSGLHGVEGFAGSAIQLAALCCPPMLPADCALVLVHILNPYGMAWGRRVNEHNVDLNRNFLPPNMPLSSAAYAVLDPLLNPATPPSFDFFYLQALGAILRYGFMPLQQAVTLGQYAFARGLFYGGERLEEGPERYQAWLRTHLAAARYVVAVDVHTGLGKPGQATLLVEEPAGAHRWLSAAFSTPLSVGYVIQGGLCAALVRLLPQATVDCVTQEFGTGAPLTVLHALREENRWHHYGDGSLNHPAKDRLKQTFQPSTRLWQERVLQQGLTCLSEALRLVTDQAQGVP
ncbi:DUF2817 domain-containing protein [Anthocerotibacter panamensis]|uniref:DUF2817 domain-containing protein n=1 Tax=Anthocerotibacter panamensis TaxID=2857077 RepID=UPI001C40456E|nr:DUF2817 domain-containing protein [Anthocerotibacter panamensis]